MSSCGELIAHFDWSTTPLGAADTWPASLRATVANMLNTRQPMLLFWGPELIQFYNDSFVPSFGIGKHPTAMGQRARECWADAWPVIGAQIEAVMSRGEPAWFEDALVPIFRNGRMEEVFWTYSYSPAHDDNGRINGTLVIVTEMTGRVLAARRLQLLSELGGALSVAGSVETVLAALGSAASAAHLDLPFLMVSSPDGTIAQFGIDGDCAAMVERSVREAGAITDPQELALAAPVPCAAWPEPVARADVHPVGTKGRMLVFGLSPRLPFDASYRSFLAQVTEQVTAALRRIETANASLATLRQRNDLLMHAPVATALMRGPEHVFELANPLYCRLVGRDPTGKGFREAFPDLRESSIPPLLDRVYETGEPVTLSEQLVPLDRRGNGVLEDTFVNFSLEPLRDEDGRVNGMMAVATDITEQVLSRKTLQNANRAKDEFLAMLGHELRNPLAPIVTALELMSQKRSDGAQERAVIERHVKHVIRLVDDLLDISRITRGLITLDRKVLDLAEVVTAAVEANAHLVAQRGHRISVEAPRGIRVNADEARLQQVVSNLITNAARYTPNGGTISVKLAAENDQAVLRVTDTGNGISADLLPKVFDLFVQGARSSDRSEGGLGLGLAIVKNLVTLHGGAVSAHSDGPDTGSVFTVQIPIALAERETATPPVARAGAVNARRVLVVDDNEDAANLLGEIARLRGHEVLVSHDPMQALELVAEFQPQVAVLDIGLPGMDGYQLASELRARVPDCRLIALTGYGQRKDRENALDAGFSEHLVKPVKVNDLLAMIAR